MFVRIFRCHVSLLMGGDFIPDGMVGIGSHGFSMAEVTGNPVLPVMDRMGGLGPSFFLMFQAFL